MSVATVDCWFGVAAAALPLGPILACLAAISMEES